MQPDPEHPALAQDGGSRTCRQEKSPPFLVFFLAPPGLERSATVGKEVRSEGSMSTTMMEASSMTRKSRNTTCRGGQGGYCACAHNGAGVGVHPVSSICSRR